MQLVNTGQVAVMLMSHRQARLRAALRSGLSLYVRGKWKAAEAPTEGSGRDTTLPSCLQSLESPPNERERLVTTGGELFPICLCSSEWRGSALHQNNPIEQNDSY